MKKKTVFLLLDAFRWDYVNEKDTPTIYEMSKKGIYAKKMKSSTGFTQRSSIFTGTWPVENGNFTMYIDDKSRAQYWFLKLIPNFILNLLESYSFTNRGVRFVLGRLNKKLHPARRFSPGFIPLTLLPKIGISEDHDPIFESGTFDPIKSIYLI